MFVIDAILSSFREILFWVILSVFLFSFLERKTNNWLEKRMQILSDKPIIGTLFATLLGAIPGCGGAIVMTTLYKKKSISFGMLAATYIATSGDASFILMSKDIGLWGQVTLLSMGVAIVTGTVIDLLKIKVKNDTVLKKVNKYDNPTVNEGNIRVHHHHHDNLFFLLSIIVIIGTIVFLLLPAIDAISGDNLFGVGGSIENLNFAVNVITGIIFVSMIALYIFMRFDHGRAHDHDDDAHISNKEFIINNGKNVVHISLWITVAVIVLEFVLQLVGEESIRDLFINSGPWVIVTAAIVGMIPGCGPQIVLTHLYLSTTFISPAAIYSNFIVQDGDAAFPLMIQDRRAMLLVKIVNLIPGLIVGVIMYLIL